MSLIYLIVLLFVLLAIYGAIEGLRQQETQGQKEEKKDNLFYRRKDYFFTISERKFFVVLQNVINGKFIIFSKVRITDLLEAPKSLGNPSFYQHFNKIKSKHVDFVICDKERMIPLLAIELDGSSHSRPDRIKRDEFVDQAFKSAGLPIMHIRNSASYNKEDLFQSLSSYLNPAADNL